MPLDPSTPLPSKGLQLGPVRLRRLLERSPAGPGFAAGMALALDLRLELPASELQRIPAQGPVLLLCDRPYGLVEGCALWPALAARRPDLRVLEDPLLELGQAGAVLGPGALSGRLARAEGHLRQGACVLAFVSRRLGQGRLGSAAVAAEARCLARLAREGGAAVQALRLQGGKRRAWMRALGLDKPGHRRRALAGALPGWSARLTLSVGGPLAAGRLQAMAQESDAAELLALRLWLLTHRGRSAASSPSWRQRLRLWRQRPLASPLPPALLEAELAALPPACRLADAGDMECWVAGAQQIPGLLREIGRLREEAFRAAGEGSGRPLDLDSFDAHYQHLFLWHRRQRCVVGAYRFTPVDQALARDGLDGLYTHSLLRFKPELLSELDPALELGRSFVAEPFQRGYAPLLLLWKGLGAWVAAHPRYRRLFGVVSMSADYQALSRELVASFVKQHLYRGDLARLTRPRNPYGPAYAPSRHDPLTWRLGAHLDEMNAWVSELEPDGKGMPVLFRQYARLGGVFFGFNVDPAFGDALDGLVCVDLVATDPRMLARTMGAEAAGRFLGWHRVRAGR